MSCAICGYEVAKPVSVEPDARELLVCVKCRQGLRDGAVDGPHWQCLTEAIWSEDDVAKGVAYRLLHTLPEAVWARETLEIAYLEPELLEWAEAGIAREVEVTHRDSNGAALSAGDTVTLIKDLPVKGAGFTAKRGTAVRGISLVEDNTGHIEGRVDGQRIVILTQFVKRA